METTGTSTSGYSGTTGAGASAMDQAKQQTQEMVQQGKEVAGRVAEQAREQVKTQISSQKEKATETLGSVAGAIRQTGDTLRQQGQEPVADLTTRAADMVEQVSGYLREHNVEELYGEIESFARRNPAIILGSAFALGFMAARFLKSSEQKAYSYGDSRAYGRYGETWNQPAGEYGYAGYQGGGYAPGYAGGYQGGSAYGSYGAETGATGRPLATAYDRAYDNTTPSMTTDEVATAPTYGGSTTAGALSDDTFDTEETDTFTGTRRE